MMLRTVCRVARAPSARRGEVGAASTVSVALSNGRYFNVSFIVEPGQCLIAAAPGRWKVGR